MIKICNSKKTLHAAVLTGLLSASAAFAGETTMVASKQMVTPEPAPVERMISGDLGVAVVSKYFSRGIVLENQGVIAQPYADLYFKLYSGEGALTSITLNLGIWSSLHEHKQGTVSGASSTTNAWYEFDYTPGISFTFAKSLTATISYFEFDSPADNFNTARSINFNLGYDDTALLGAFALHPHIAVLAELNAPGFAGLGAGGWYYEAGIAPSHAFGPIAVTIPINVGLGDKNFYADSGDIFEGTDVSFGYFSAGVTVSASLKFIPEGYGTWTASTGVTYYSLGNSTQTVNVAPGNPDGQENDFVFSGTVGVAF